MENVTGVSLNHREVAEVPHREIGMQHRDPRFGRGGCGETFSVGGLNDRLNNKTSGSSPIHILELVRLCIIQNL